MTISHDQRLAGDIEVAVLAVDGVAEVFRAGSAASRVADAGARLLGIREEDAPLVRIEDGQDGCRVDVAIGIHAAAGATGTARAVHAAIVGLLRGRGADAEVHVTVVHVEDSPTPH